MTRLVNQSILCSPVEAHVEFPAVRIMIRAPSYRTMVANDVFVAGIVSVRTRIVMGAARRISELSTESWLLRSGRADLQERVTANSRANYIAFGVYDFLL